MKPLREPCGMDSALRRRFLKSIDFDLAAVGLAHLSPTITVNGPGFWPREAAWWRSADPTPIVRSGERLVAGKSSR